MGFWRKFDNDGDSLKNKLVRPKEAGAPSTEYWGRRAASDPPRQGEYLSASPGDAMAQGNDDLLATTLPEIQPEDTEDANVADKAAAVAERIENLYAKTPNADNDAEADYAEDGYVEDDDSWSDEPSEPLQDDAADEDASYDHSTESDVAAAVPAARANYEIGDLPYDFPRKLSEDELGAAKIVSLYPAAEKDRRPIASTDRVDAPEDDAWESAEAVSAGPGLTEADEAASDSAAYNYTTRAKPVLIDDLAEEGPSAPDFAGRGYYDAAGLSDDNGGRRTALYLAGAASISAICAAVYFLLPHNNADQQQTARIGEDVSDAGRTVTVARADPPAALPAGSESKPEDPIVTGADARTDFSASGFSDDVIADAPDDAVAVKADDLIETQETAAKPDPAPATKPVAPPAETQYAAIEPPAPEERNLSASKEAFAAPTQTAVEASPIVVETPKAPKAVIDAPARRTAAVSAPQPVAAASVAPAPNAQPATFPFATGSVAERAVENARSVGVYPDAADQRAFNGAVNQAFETLPGNGERSIGLTASEFGQLRLSETYVKPQAPVDAASLPVQGLLHVPNGATLHTEPNARSAGSAVPAGVLVQQLDAVVGSDGREWKLVGHDGQAIGYIPDQKVLTARLGDGTPVSLWKPDTAALIVPGGGADKTCRDFNFSGPGGAFGGTACRNASGQWIVQPGAASGRTLAAVSAPTVLSRTAFDAPDAAPAGLGLASLPIDADTAEILFDSGKHRRAQRHGAAKVRSDIDRIFASSDGADGATVPVVDAARTIGVIQVASAQAESPQPRAIERAADLSDIDTPLTIKSDWVKAKGQLKLLTAPDGQAASTDPIPPGAVMQTVAVTRTTAGEDWSLVGANGVGYGFVKTDLLDRTTESASNDIAHLAPASVVIDTAMIDNVTCRSATYATATVVRETKACLGGDGHWRMTSRNAPNYTPDVRHTASILH